MKAKKTKTLLTNPDLMNILINEVQHTVSEARDDILSLLLFISGRLVKNSRAASYNVIVHSDSGEGKDAIVRAVGKLLPTDLFIARSSISPTALKHWLSGHEGWTWKCKALYVEDIPISTLNCDDFKNISGTEEKISTVTSTKQIAEDLRSGGKPPIILTMADIYMKAQTKRRFAICHIEERDGQKILLKISQESSHDIDYISPECVEIRNALSKLKQVRVLIPYKEVLALTFISDRKYRTLFGRFLDIIAASAALHQKQRTTKHGSIIANQTDYEYACIALIKVIQGIHYSLSSQQRDIIEIMKRKYSEKRVGNAEEFTVRFLADLFSMYPKNMRMNLVTLKKEGVIESKIIRGGIYVRRPVEVYFITKETPFLVVPWRVIAKDMESKRYKRRNRCKR
ncbi:MAG TPA: hypothetical protein VMW23_08800 [Sedimentisphaerales bacterium]|nr:hypothetical protein [Sedimentisphaerales bacterium]